MRIDGWKGKQVFDNLTKLAMEGANDVMDAQVEGAKKLCPGPPESKMIARSGANAMREVFFHTKRGKEVNFIADTWVERIPGTLRSSIRKVEKYDRAGNIRVYAGHTQAYYARFVEYGTAKTGWGGPAKAQPYMRPTWQRIKPTIKDRIAAKMRQEPEVK